MSYAEKNMVDDKAETENQGRFLGENDLEVKTRRRQLGKTWRKGREDASGRGSLVCRDHKGRRIDPCSGN